MQNDLADKLIERAKQNPYFHLDGYMERYWLTPFDPDASSNIRIHRILRSDDDRAMHDHPWPSTSVILKGGYWEVMPLRQDQDPKLDMILFTREWRQAGDVVQRNAYTRHRIVMPENQECWSMFIMGRYEQKWGFYTPEGKVYWRDYLNDYTSNTSSDPV